MKQRARFGVVLMAVGVAAAALAATALKFGPAVNVSQTATPTEKAKSAMLAYQDGAVFRKAWLVTYADGPVGAQNVYVKTSVDQGVTWSAPVLLSRDGAGAPTGGQTIVTQGGLSFVADNDKSNLYAAPVTSGPRVIVTWSSAYCPLDPAGAGAGHVGGYDNPQQGSSDQGGDGTKDRPFYCMWTATTTDPALSQWTVTQLTDGRRDAIGDVVAGNATGTAFAMAWQEDPAGLQPGEAEGPGDGGSGAVVTPGTNIWYTHAASPDGATLRSNIAQLSDNNSTATGQPGASRVNLQISGSTAVLAYEETACPGGSGGRCIVYHSFSYSSHDTNAAGTVVSDPARNARRVRFALQGDAAAGDSKLRVLLLWREATVIEPGAPSDIIVRRGLRDTDLRTGSTGFLASDVLADAPQAVTAVSATRGNANAHRAILRGSFVALAYDMTPDIDGANPERTDPPTANYNLHLIRSSADGAPGSWSAATNLTGITDPLVNVVEPRLVPTPGTIVNPLTGTPDPGDTQNTNVLYLSYATESNDLAKTAGRLWVTRSTDQGATFEPFVPASADTAGQSEAQLRATPDGSSVGVLWMGEQTPGDPLTKDAMFALAAPIELPALTLTGTSVPFDQGRRGELVYTIANAGTGDAVNVVLQGNVPTALVLTGVSDTGACTIDGATFRCTLAGLAAGQSRELRIQVTGTTVGAFPVTASVANDVLETDTTDNTVTTTVTVQRDDGGFGCTVARGPTPLDPTLPLLAGLGVAGLAWRRWQERTTRRSRARR